MKTADALRAYAKSPLAIASAGAFLVLGAVGLSLMEGGVLLGLLGGAALWLAFSAVAVQTRLGAKAVLAVRDSDEDRRNREALERARADRDRLARMRLPDPELAKLAECLVQVSGEYLEAAARSKARDPEAEARIADSIDAVDLYLKELDEASTEKRYSLPDANPFSDSQARTKATLAADIDAIRKGRLAAEGGLPPEALMRIKEELK